MLWGWGKRTRIADEALDFRTLPRVPGRFTMHIAGEQFEGRQETIRTLHRGDSLLLRREPDNRHDRNAIAVTVEHGACIGYITRSNARWLAPIIDSGFTLQAEVAHLFDDDDDGIIDVQVHLANVPDQEDVQAASMITRACEAANDMMDKARSKKTRRAKLRWLKMAYTEIEKALRTGAGLKLPSESLDALRRACSSLSQGDNQIDR